MGVGSRSTSTATTEERAREGSDGRTTPDRCAAKVSNILLPDKTKPNISFNISHSSVIELGEQFQSGNRDGNSGLSVLRTFRLLRILKLVRFMPNLRRQLFVMLRTMDNVAIFFSLLILFIFIFR